ncbi:hypothetical protein AVEN_11043-1 [Araneus ventricosus]|uniref:C2H2-type domain-containing protein n=1 Tax=Araneus ventricosus TaxID=182803 RepID=A0A4Y2LH50_ARAVE|nr:hypothetical protein AVEN_11043-1 [Araneus ventricosus]
MVVIIGTKSLLTGVNFSFLTSLQALPASTLRLNGTLSIGQFIFLGCGKGFRRKDNFLIHYRHHTGEKTFSCNRYEKQFFAQYHLTLHLQIHSGERPCDECERRFANKCQLTRHSRTHNGEKS